MKFTNKTSLEEKAQVVLDILFSSQEERILAQ